MALKARCRLSGDRGHTCQEIHLKLLLRATGLLPSHPGVAHQFTGSRTTSPAFAVNAKQYKLTKAGRSKWHRLNHTHSRCSIGAVIVIALLLISNRQDGTASSAACHSRREAFHAHNLIFSPSR